MSLSTIAIRFVLRLAIRYVNDETSNAKSAGQTEKTKTCTVHCDVVANSIIAESKKKFDVVNGEEKQSSILMQFCASLKLNDLDEFNAGTVNRVPAVDVENCCVD